MIQSLIKASQILESLKSQESDFTIAEISKNTSMPPSTVHRILNTLIECGYVVKDDSTHMYRLGPGLIPLGIAATSNINTQRESYKALKELSQLTKEDSFLIIKSGYKGLVISKVEGVHSLKIVENFGLEIELHCGAIRKAILAYQSEEFIEEYLASGLRDYIEREVDISVLRDELKEIRKNGVSTSNSEYISNAVGIGSPVFKHNDELFGAIGIIVPTERINENSEPFFVESVKKCAQALTRDLGSSFKI